MNIEKIITGVTLITLSALFFNAHADDCISENEEYHLSKAGYTLDEGGMRSLLQKNSSYPFVDAKSLYYCFSYIRKKRIYALENDLKKFLTALDEYLNASPKRSEAPYSINLYKLDCIHTLIEIDEDMPREECERYLQFARNTLAKNNDVKSYLVLCSLSRQKQMNIKSDLIALSKSDRKWKMYVPQNELFDLYHQELSNEEINDLLNNWKKDRRMHNYISSLAENYGLHPQLSPMDIDKGIEGLRNVLHGDLNAPSLAQDIRYLEQNKLYDLLPDVHLLIKRIDAQINATENLEQQQLLSRLHGGKLSACFQCIFSLETKLDERETADLMKTLRKYLHGTQSSNTKHQMYIALMAAQRNLGMDIKEDLIKLSLTEKWTALSPQHDLFRLYGASLNEKQVFDLAVKWSSDKEMSDYILRLMQQHYFSERPK